jgi:hypothetical protein
MNWIEKNLRKVIYIAFLIPILLVALVSISHVTKWYGISNPTSWSIYLSVAVEIAALSTLAAIAARMGRKVYFPFAIVTLIQFIGNVFFAYQFIDIASQSFKDWVDLVSPLVQYLGIESGDFVGHKRFLAFFAGGMLPIISLSFLHMLVKFEEEEKRKILEEPTPEIEEPKLNATPEDLEKLEVVLSKINEDKFGVLLQEVPQPVEEPVEQPLEEPIEEEKSGPMKKVLSYLRRNA